jgi:hypothetical protein
MCLRWDCPASAHLNQVAVGAERQHGFGIGCAEEGELCRDQSQRGRRSPCPDVSGKLNRPIEVTFHSHLEAQLRQKKAPCSRGQACYGKRIYQTP